MTGAVLQDANYGYCSNDSVVFKVEIILFGELESASFPPVSTVNSNIICNDLQRSLKQLLQSEDVVDVKLNIGTAQLNAHRCILCARSPVFNAMLTLDMAERTTGTIIIDDMDLEVMKECLVFMYTDECSDSMVIVTPKSIVNRRFFSSSIKKLI
jgi:hypothetical protein